MSLIGQIKHRSITSSKGFTLVEVVLAISILAIIMTVAYSSLNYIVRTKKLLDDRRDSTAIANSVLTRLSREIQLATKDPRLLPASGSTGGGSIRGAFEGSNDSLGRERVGGRIDFMADNAGQYIPDGSTNTGTVMITYRVERDPESERTGDDETFYLIRDEVPNIRPVDKAYEKRMTFPITKNLVSMAFQFYDSTNAQWSDEWDKASEIPALIKLSLALRSPQGRTEEFVTVLSTFSN